MKLQMAKNSLFAILLRSPWWVSLLVAAGTVMAARLVLPIEYAVFSGLPFLVISGVAAWRQLRAPSDSSVEAAYGRLREMGWDACAAALEAGFRRDGYATKRIGGGADFELEKNGRLGLAAAKRWKASRTGIEPLRELQALREKREAGECLYLCAGDVTATARAYAAEKNIRLIEGVELARLAGVMSA